MKELRQHLEKLRQIKRSRHHPLIHKIRKHYKISKKTLLYVKEYGPHSNVPKTIIKESIKVLLLASLLSSMGGFALEHIKAAFVTIIPLIILLPVLNDMIGDYGMIVSARFTTMLHTGVVKKKWYRDSKIRDLFLQVLSIAMITTVISASASVAIAFFSGYTTQEIAAEKIFMISIFDVLILVTLLFTISIIGGLYVFKKGEDPDNFLIPITTSIADFGNMLILSFLIITLF